MAWRQSRNAGISRHEVAKAAKPGEAEGLASMSGQGEVGVELRGKFKGRYKARKHSISETLYTLLGDGFLKMLLAKPEH